MTTISRSTRLVLALLTAATIAWGTQWGGHAQSASALVFNGVDQYVTFGPAPGLGAASFTLEVWFKRTGSGVATGTGNGGITAIPLLTKGRAEVDNSNRDMNYFLGLDSATGKLLADFEEGALQASPGLNHPITGNTGTVANVWYHAAATFNSSTGAWKLFLNGQEDATQTLGANRAPRSDSIQHAALATAITSSSATPAAAPAGFFAGMLDEARIWNVARTQAEIQSSRGLEITSATGLIGRWGLNEASGTTVSGVGPNGTLTPTATPPAWGAGLVLTGAAPPVPQNLSASPGNGLVTIAWNGTSQPDLIGYNVYRSTSTPVPTGVAPLNASPVSTAIYTDQPVTNGTTYYYAVKTVFPSGESAASNEAFATPEQFAGSALQFNGSDQHITFGAAPGLGTATFTLETWFKRTANGAGTSTGTGGITDVIPLISKGRAQADGDNRDMNYIFGIEASTGRLAADFEDTATGGNHPVKGQNVVEVSTTAWHHAAATYDGTEWRLYLDGVLEIAETENATPRFDSIQHAALATAMTSTGVAAGRFAGVLEEVRIWNYARSQAQIQASMQQEITTASGLLGRWGMNEATGTSSTADSSGNLNTGNFSSPAPTWSAGYPFIADGLAPAPPNNVVATPGNQAITLSWNANSEADLAGYNVYRSTTSPVSTFTSPINGTTLVTSAGYADNGLTNGTAYYYVVTAVDIFGNPSDPSAEASATPQQPNLPPGVSAGADQSVARPNPATLAGSASDDGLPSGTLNVTWSVHTGPTGVTFGNANAVSTTASFATAGTYVLRLTASDGVLSASDDMTVVVTNPVLVGAGDIAPDCTAGASIANAQATGVLLNGISGTVFTAGDNAYQDGTTQQFVQCYDAAWGSVRARTRPATGNHDYNPNPAKGAGNNANPYFDYFNGDGSPTGPAGDRDKGYYSYDIENWHVVVLNSECGAPGLWNVNGCAVGSAQEVWLRADLANSSTNNIIAIWHKPRFSSSAADSAIAFMQPLWQALYEYGVDIVLGGHWHNYERLAPTDANGLQDDAFGIRQFIVGSGGVPFSNFGTVRGTSEVRQNSDHGVLKLTLHANSYDWEFIPVPGKTFNDSGSGSVHGPPPPPSIAGIAPPGGSPAGGTLVTITGAQFGTLTPTTVLFGSTPATNINCSSSTVCTATSPAGTGTVDITVIVGGQVSATHSLAKFTYNVAPTVSAGANQNISTLNTTLIGSASDDGQPNPPGALALAWSKVSGPGTVTFGSPSATSTTATFSSVGTYSLRLTANDGLFATSSDVTVRVTTDPGSANKALQFNGTSQYVTFGPAPELGSTSFTIETWFKREGSGTTAGTGTNGVTAVPLVTKGRNETDGNNTDMNYFLGINADRVLVADFEDQASGANHPVTGNRRIADGVWYHAAATYDGTRWRLYVNGVLDVESAAIGATPRSDSIQHAAIGSALNSTGVPNGFFAGVIDEARIWNVARSGADIAATMGSAVASAPNLVGRWGLNEGAGDVATDDAGVANDGTLNGSPAWVDGTPFAPTPLDGNHGVTFNGSSDYVTFGQAPGLGTATFTIETWFKRTGAGVGTSTGAFTGTQAIPLVTKGRGEADGSNLDSNYFLGIHSTTGTLIADFESMANGANAPIEGTTPIAISATEWHHAAATYDGTTFNLYLDGELEATLTPAGNPVPRFDSIQHAGLATAMTSTGARAGFFAGVLDEARIWNYARSQSQIEDGMTRAMTGAPGLLGRWGFDTAFGVVDDTTGNDQVGTLFGPAWNWVVGAPFTAPTNLAPIVNAGSDQTITLPDAASLSGSVSDDSVTGSVTHAWTKVSGPGTVTFQDPAAIATIAVFSASGTYELRLSADDGELVGSDTLTVIVNSGPVNQAPIVDAGGDQVITTGTTASLAGSVSDDGLPGIDVDVEWTQVSGPGTVIFDDATAASTIASFSAIGSYVLRFSADDGQLVSSDTLTVTVNPSATNNALDLGGTNAYINLGPAPALGASTFTLELWFRRDGTGVTTGTGTGGLTAVPLVSKGMAQADGSNVDMNYFLGISSANVLAADFEDNATGLNHPVSGTTAILADGQWHHGAATYDGTTWRLYLDGALQTTLVIGNFTPRADSIQWGAIGSASDSAGGITSGQRGFFAGVVDEVRIWNHARSPQQIADSLNDEITSAAGLIGRWGFNEGAGATVADSSGSSINGNLVGTNYAWTAGAPFTLNAAPDQPTMNAPTDGATNVPTSPLLDVSVSDPDLQPLTVTFFGRPVTAASAPEFTIVAVPDTQHYVDDVNRAPTFTAQTQWIVDNQATKNIAFVTHLGDIVEHIDAQPIEWDRADLSLSLLQTNNLKWGLAPGNHDLNSSGVGAGFDAKFPASRFFGVFPWYGGYLGSDPINDPIDRGNKDNYELFSVGGLDFIIIHLEYDMPDYSVAWANRILAQYPNRRAIITTHLFLNASGVRPTTVLNRANGTPAETVWQQLVRPNCNVFLVLNGHYPGEANRTDSNVCGKPVHQLASDYQSRVNGGDGWLRYMVFKPSENKIHVFTYSPTLNGGLGSFETDANSQFVLDYEMQGTSFSVIATKTAVPSGSSTTTTWSSLDSQTEHEWYVTVGDGFATTTSPVSRFTTTGGALHHLVVSPASTSISAGGSQTYTAEGFDAGNNSLGDVTSSTTFSISPNGSCTGATCTATVAGAHTVTGTNGVATGTANLTVSAGSLHHMVLSPSTSSIAAGGSQSYTADGRDSFENSLGAQTGVTYSIAPNGSCTSSACTASVTGSHTVTGTKGSATGSATLTVNAGALHHLILSPSTASIAAGGSQSYTADGRDSFENSLGAQTGVTYTITPNGSCTAASCTATVIGAHTVTGTKGTATGTASLTVNAGPLHHLVLSPATATISEGGSQAYTAQGRDQFDNSLGNVTGTTTFSIAPNGSCTLATCGASSAGAHTVTGTNGTATGTASLSVIHTNVPPVAAAATATTAQDTAATLTLSATDSDSPALTFAIVTGPTRGTLGSLGAPSCSGAPVTCTTTVVYTPALDYSGPDSFTFRASDGTDVSGAATASITVNPAAIVFRTASFAHNGGASSVTLTKPVSVVADDLMLASIVMSGAATITPPSGWAVVRDPGSNAALDTTSGTLRHAVYFKVAGSAEPSSYTWSLSASRNVAGGLASYSGVNTSSPFDVAGGTANASSASITTPSLSTSVDNTRLVGLFGIAANTSITPPSRMSERGEVSGGKVKVATEIADVNQAAIAAGPAHVATAGSAAVNVGQLVALKPAGAPGSQPPAAPASLTATAGSAQVTLNWSASATATGYNVYRSTTAGGPYSLPALATTGPSTTTYLDAPVDNNTTYYYVVRAFNGDGESLPSPEAFATPVAPCAAISLTPTSLSGGTVGSPYNQAITATGGTAPYVFTLTAGTLPPGVTLSNAGLISGTPKNNAGNKTYTFTVTATAGGCSGSRQYTVAISR